MVAEKKTEAIFLHGKAVKLLQAQIRVGTYKVPIEAQMKYLGLVLDSIWYFKEHMNRLVPRLKVLSACLGRLMSNIGGPGQRARRLHVGVLNSVALYRAPIWAEALAVNHRMREQLRKTHKILADRVIRGYKTISHEAATTLASMPPLELQALMYRRMYFGKKELQGRIKEDEALARAIREMKHQTRQALLHRWKRMLAHAIYGRRVFEAVQPCLHEWVGRDFGTLTYRLTQVLTGHGCFGEYMCRIGKEPTAKCHHCDYGHDSAQHTVQDCPAWVVERGVVARELGQDLSLPTAVRSMLESERNWGVFASFCEAVMLQKEAAEKIRRQ
ncbi:uncharacterized protein LOC105187940, partial [Harpegnathos saltator]|uniref:uncharacterized protein LOC105187940 n=1 Tax=Harpegnathos saltator TaxID=610380 RepID=UPI000DBED837